jgi:hypothetical protein
MENSRTPRRGNRAFVVVFAYQQLEKRGFAASVPPDKASFQPVSMEKDMCENTLS